MDAIDRDVRLLFREDLTAPNLVCTESAGSANLTRLQERTYRALLLMRQVRSSESLPWTSQSLYDWFVTTVGTVRFEGTRSFCCGPGRTITIGVTTSYDEGFPKLIEGLVHEARHVDVGDHTCGFEPSLRAYTRDRRPDDLGAFGAQVYALEWMARSEGDALSPGDRRYVSARARILRASAFCEECS